MESDDEFDDEFGPGPAVAAPQDSSMARELLASFYGKLASSNSAQPGAPKAPVAPIDAEHFDADGYVRALLKTQKLQALLVADDALCRESKALGSDMQMLVYENYSKFISATDTIREMRSDVAKMDDEMNALNVTMEGIERMSGVVNACLAEKRSQIDTLVRTRRTLKRLEFLFDLPRKLEAAIAAEAFDDALKYHRINEDVLSSYSHIASLREIHAEARAILARLKRDLAASLKAPASAGKKDRDYKIAANPEVLADRVRLLGALGADAGAAADAAVATAASYLGTLLDAALKADAEGDAKLGAKADAETSIKPRSATSRVEALGAAFVPQLVAAAAALRSLVAGGEAGGDAAFSVVALVLYPRYLTALESIIESASAPLTADQDIAVESAETRAKALELAHAAVERAPSARSRLRRSLHELSGRLAFKHLELALQGLKRTALDRLVRELFVPLAAPEETLDEASLVQLLRMAPKVVADGVAGDIVEALKRAEPMLSYLAEDDDDDAPYEAQSHKSLGASVSNVVVQNRVTAFFEWFGGAAAALVGVARDGSFKAAGEARFSAAKHSTESDFHDAPDARICDAAMDVAELCDSVGATEAKALFRVAARRLDAAQLPHGAAMKKADATAERIALVAVACASTLQHLEAACLRAAAHVARASCDVGGCCSAAAPARAAACRGLSQRAVALCRGVVSRLALNAVVERNADAKALEHVLEKVALLADRLAAALDPSYAPKRAGAKHARRNRPMPKPVAQLTSAPNRDGAAGIELDVERLFAASASDAPPTSAKAKTGASLGPDAALVCTRHDAAIALLRPLAKTVVEGVRAMTLDADAYARVEAQARAFHAALPDHVVDVVHLTDLDAVVAELLQAASERTVD